KRHSGLQAAGRDEFEICGIGPHLRLMVTPSFRAGLLSPLRRKSERSPCNGTDCPRALLESLQVSAPASCLADERQPESSLGYKFRTARHRIPRKLAAGHAVARRRQSPQWS